MRRVFTRFLEEIEETKKDISKLPDLYRDLILGVTPAHVEGQLATEDMRSQVPYEILSVNCVVEILDKVFKLA